MSKDKIKIGEAKIEGKRAGKKVVIEEAIVEGKAEEIPQAPKTPTTTREEDITTAGQRRINLIWEMTQATISVLITGAMIYCIVKDIDTKELSAAFFMVITMYLLRTNHTKIGGVFKGQEGR